MTRRPLIYGLFIGSENELAMMLRIGISIVVASSSMKSVSSSCPTERRRAFLRACSLLIPYHTPSPVSFLLVTCVSSTSAMPTRPLNSPTALASEYWPFWMPMR